MTQTSTTMYKSLADENRSRDVRRRIEVIHKKLADLQELGIPCAFCYSSARNTGSIFTLGDSRITDVIERHKNEILVNLSGENSEQSEAIKSKEIHLILPPLPSPLEELNRQTLQSMIVGILKDLGVKWTDSTPTWWPLDIPFVHPRAMSQSYHGNLVQALRNILASVYSYFSYDVTKYIANQLEQETDSAAATTTEMSRVQPQAKLDDEEKMTFTPKNAASNGDTAPAVERKPPTKPISNFTVENILMGPQYSSSSSSSHSPTSTSTGSSQISPTVDYSSVLPGNWVSHPPVKYTKYTMLSPGSMGGEDKSKRKSRTEISNPTSRPRNHSSSSNLDGSPSLNDSHNLTMRRVPSNPITRVPSGEYSFVSKSYTSAHQFSRQDSSEEAGTPQATSPQSHTMLTTKSVSTLPVIQAIPYSTPAGKAVLQHGFPPSQQFVLLVPSTTASINENLQAVVCTNQSQHSSPKLSVAKPTDVSKSNSPPQTHSTSDTDKRLLELTYRPIAPKNKPVFSREMPSISSTPTVDRKVYKRTSSGSKPQKLRFHMTTVVKRPKHSVMTTSSMTVESPSSIANERTKTTSFILDSQSSAEKLAEKHITRAKNSFSSDKGPAEDAEKSEGSPHSTASNEDTNTHINHAVPVLKNSQKSPETKEDKLTFIHCHEDKQFEMPNDNGRTTRSYTRRKRELTFHLYEDPETAFKIKRNCKD